QTLLQDPEPASRRGADSRLPQAAYARRRMARNSARHAGNRHSGHGDISTWPPSVHDNGYGARLRPRPSHAGAGHQASPSRMGT
nr:hypothetical protein [Tanacetum cinerariifolium]